MKLKAIYEPKGRAKEYTNLALDIFSGCTMGCTYCFNTLKKVDFHKEVKKKNDLLVKVEHDCLLIKGSEDKVLLSFSCDPYNDIDDEVMTVRKVLELFKTYSINFQILTKGGTRAIRDFDLYKPGDAFASTLTFLDPVKSIEWEPNAPLPINRIEALKTAHEIGIETWVSLEPVIDPEETLRIIEAVHPYVDLFKVGTLNHHELTDTIDWKSFGERAVKLLESLGKNYYIKNDLKNYMNK